MMGQADDWTPAKPCEALVARAAERWAETRPSWATRALITISTHPTGP